MLPPHDPENDDDDQNNLITIITMVILSKDARLPEQLQRAMAAEAEAAREARAKVIDDNVVVVDENENG